MRDARGSPQGNESAEGLGGTPSDPQGESTLELAVVTGAARGMRACVALCIDELRCAAACGLGERGVKTAESTAARVSGASRFSKALR